MSVVCPVGHPLGVGTTYCRLCGRDYIQIEDTPATAAMGLLAADHDVSAPVHELALTWPEPVSVAPPPPPPPPPPVAEVPPVPMPPLPMPSEPFQMPEVLSPELVALDVPVGMPTVADEPVEHEAEDEPEFEHEDEAEHEAQDVSEHHHHARSLDTMSLLIGGVFGLGGGLLIGAIVGHLSR